MSRISLTAIFITIAMSAFGQSEPAKASGFLDFNGYYDTRDRSEVTLNILANLPNPRFNYFSLSNITGQEPNADVVNLYSEQCLRWRVSNTSPFYINLQGVIRGGIHNDAIRIGWRWVANQTTFLKKIFDGKRISYAITAFVAEAAYNTDRHFFTQLEHAYNIKLLKGKIYISGFADQNMRKDETSGDIITDWVTEHQVGIKTFENLYVVSEFRINEYLADTTGWGFGLEYLIRF